MRSVQCEIVERNRLIEKKIIKNKDDMTIIIDMFSGWRDFDVEQQYINLNKGNSSSNQEVYELFCSFIKFGEMQQEKRTFTVTLSYIE